MGRPRQELTWSSSLFLVSMVGRSGAWHHPRNRQHHLRTLKTRLSCRIKTVLSFIVGRSTIFMVILRGQVSLPEMPKNPCEEKVQSVVDCSPSWEVLVKTECFA